MFHVLCSLFFEFVFGSPLSGPIPCILGLCRIIFQIVLALQCNFLPCCVSMSDYDRKNNGNYLHQQCRWHFETLNVVILMCVIFCRFSIVVKI